ncbi:unnamed protein product [Adineta ricciae]|uniref:SEA domain-containing protein n=1 Tax=Adineta ricciae TaxID=249248 RepID=A0A814AGQ0_ADIRI|nr:unnamed protein product [Adineta ricciae]CAF0933164.1 unnamed protein product [Adineta ricciae]
MTWFKGCASNQKSKRLRFFLLASGILVVIGVTVAIIVVVIKSKSSSNSPTPDNVQRSIAPPFNITYLLSDSLTNSSNQLKFSPDERSQIARDFESNLNLSTRNVLEIRDIIYTTAMGNKSTSRRKRSIQCDQDVNGMSGPALSFDFNLIKPNDPSCQNQTCISKILSEIYKNFRNIRSLIINSKNQQTRLRLCSVGSLPVTADDFVEETTITTQSFTSIKQTAMPSTTTLTTVPQTTTATTQMFTTAESTMTTLNFTTSQVSRMSTVFNTETTIILPNTTSNNTQHNAEICIRKLPLLQEQTSPYRISLTSTLFYQDEHILVVVGASKFEITLDMQTKQQHIVINGVMAYNKCQRTIDLSLPTNI